MGTRQTDDRNILFGGGIGRFVFGMWAQWQIRRLHLQELRQATEQVVQVADPMIRHVNNYEKTLLHSVEEALHYFDQLVDGLPGPVDLSRTGYEADPTVKFLFTSPDEVDEVVRISSELQTLRERGHVGEVVALLTMTRRERTVFGYEQEGEMVLRDVAQQAVDFIDHRIVAPSATMGDTKGLLMQRGLGILATAAMETITGLKAQKARLREQKEYLGAMLRIMGGRRSAWESFAPLDPAQQEEIVRAEQRLSEVQGELVEVQRQLDGPEDALTLLSTVMNRPREELHAHSYDLRLNWKRVRVSEKDAASGQEVRLAELSNRSGELRRSAVLVRLRLGE